MIRFILSLVAFIIGFLVSPMRSLHSEEISFKERQFVEKISQTIDRLNNEKGLVWKDFDLNCPIVVTFSKKNIYAFGLNSKNPLWHVKNDGILFSEVDHWGVTLVAMQDKFLMDNEEAFVFSIDLNEHNSFPDRPVLVLVHELFHRYQFAHFKKMDDIGYYADKLNRENLALIALEERILVDFLKVRKEFKLDVLKDYMAVNQKRHEIMNPSSVKWEQFQQVMEGLADYVSIETADRFAILPRFDGDRHLQITLSGYIYSEDAQELAVKWSHYGLGATLGKALDFLNVVDWKAQIEKGSSQGQILKNVIELSDDELISRLIFAKKLYKYDEIEKEIDGKVTSFTKMVDGLMADYEEQDGLVAMIERPRDVGINGGGSSLGIYHLENGTTVSVKDKSFSSSTDNNWKLELKEIPFLLQNGAGARIIKIDHHSKIILDGKPYTIEELKKENHPKSFKTLFWDCSTSVFESNDRVGKLSVSHERLEVIFNP